MILKTAALVACLGMIVVNFLANALPINDVTTGAISDSYPNLFAPAGITFSIWGVIYLLLIAYSFYQFRSFAGQRSKERLVRKIAPFFIATSVANISWIFAWHYFLPGLSLLIIALLLYFLIRIADLAGGEKLSGADFFFIRLPFSVYFGWVTVATIANATVFLVSINWDGFGVSEVTWTVVVLFLGAVIGILRMLRDRSIPYGLVFAWAYAGILLRHVSPEGFGGRYPPVAFSAGLLTLFFLGFIAYLLRRGSRTGGRNLPRLAGQGRSS